MIENKDQLIDIYDIWYQPFYLQGWFYNLIILFILAFLVVLCYFFYKTFISKEKVIDCSVVAYKALDSLRNFQIVSLQDSKEVYFKLSLIIKAYLASRYDKLFMKLTDKEIIKYAENYISDTDIRLLQKLLQNMTRVKFEHEIAATDRLEKDIELIREFIGNTMPLDDIKGN